MLLTNELECNSLKFNGLRLDGHNVPTSERKGVTDQRFVMVLPFHHLFSSNLYSLIFDFLRFLVDYQSLTNKVPKQKSKCVKDNR